jgi:hypothetical protein
MLSVLLLAGVAPGISPRLEAQSSMFGARGLGLPGRPLTPRAQALGGSLGLFDGESDLNPAALANLTAVSAGFVMTPTWRRWEGPAGPATLRDTRFPLASVGGPIPGTHVGLGVSVGSYGGRDFRLASIDTVTLRGQQVEVHDTLTSLGGLGQIRLAVGWAISPKTSVGIAGYWITGSNRLDSRRAFADTTFLRVKQTAEVSYGGWGAAIGITQRLGSATHVALVLRSDGHANVDRDSTRAYTVDLPYSVYAGAAFRVSRRLAVVAAGNFRSWSSADADLRRQGGVGARDMTELSLGVEYARSVKMPQKLPLRLGVRYATLPFPIESGGRPTAVSVSAGTGTRFAQDRAGIDLALEQTWRREGSAYRERAFSVVLGLSVRPYGVR